MVLLLALVPFHVLRVSGGGIALVAILAVASFVLAGMLRHRWAWWAGTVLQLGLLTAGFFVHASLTVLGVLFGLVWAYVLRVRSTVLG
jgi:hypothetical protein